MHGWSPSDALLIQIITVSGIVVNGLFQVYNRQRARRWETEDRIMRAKAAKEREEISQGLDQNTRLTAGVLQQVAESQGKTLDQTVEIANHEFERLLDKYRPREDAGAVEENRHPG